jgi:alkylhydroperoxidase family enzyme
MTSSLADDVRATATDAYGTVPNLFEETNRYTGMPGAVYVAADAALSEGILSPAEQQVVLLTMAQYHDSRYDAVVHARMALDAGLSPQVIDTLLAGDAPADDRLRALAEATRRSCEKRGWLDADTLQALEARGVGRAALYEIFAFIGMKTFSAFTAHLADPAVDDPLKIVEQSLEHVPDEPDTIERRRLFVG